MSMPRTVHTLESLKARCEEVGECWEWLGYFGNGVPQVIAWPEGKKKMVSVRRLIREVSTRKTQPDGHFGVTCGNPRCVHPDHAIWRGQAAHMRHMAKKRRVTPAMAMKMRQARMDIGAAKLNPEKAEEIRTSIESGPVLAERYGVSKGLINRIKRGEVWRVLVSPFSGLFHARRS